MSILTLWAPILVAAVLVFVASSVIHMVLGYHNSDHDAVPDEDGLMDAFRQFNLPPGDYVVPKPHGSAHMKSEEFRAKVEKGPVAMITVFPPDAMTNMTGALIQWFLYCVLVGVFAAYLGSRMLTAGAPYLSVFRLTGTVAFCCYAMAHMQRSIWYYQKWSTTLKNMFDGLVYGLLTAGAFGWLWPEM